MTRKLYYNGELLELSADNAHKLLRAFSSGESGMITLDMPSMGNERIRRYLHVAYGPGIPLIYDDDPLAS